MIYIAHGQLETAMFTKIIYSRLKESFQSALRIIEMI